MNKIRNFALSSVALLMLGGMADSAPASNSSSGIIALNSLPDPPTILATAQVLDVKGTAVGAVQKIVMDGSSRPVTVDVALLGSGAVVQVDASKFNYDQAHNVLTATLDAQQIAAAPHAPPG
ncbi:MAG TPA: hypothetical protein VNW15_00635 [Rhizomicrobium sp.]|nr:hypothetical protein [Rhizomicrobium sp.]